MATTRPDKKAYLTTRELEDRYLHLLDAMQWVACLSRGEALACLRDYRDGFPFSGEAVNHYGGTVLVLRAASRELTRMAVTHWRLRKQEVA